MKLSKRKEEQLYRVIHESIMDARIKIAMSFNEGKINLVDDIMSDLCLSVPRKAIEIFK